MEDARRATRGSNVSPVTRLRSGKSPPRFKSPGRNKTRTSKSPQNPKSTLRTKSPGRKPGPARSKLSDVESKRKSKRNVSPLPGDDVMVEIKGTLPRAMKETRHKEIFESETSSFIIKRTLTPTSYFVLTNKDDETQKEEKNPISTKSLKVNISNLKLLPAAMTDGSLTNKITSTSRSSSTIKTTSSSIDTQDFGTNNQKDTSGDAEVYKITSVNNTVSSLLNPIDRLRRSVSKSYTPQLTVGHTTPTTEMSRRSRSISQLTAYETSTRSEFSDEESEKFESFSRNATKATLGEVRKSFSRQIQPPREFGGVVGAFFWMLLVPCVVYYLQFVCHKKLCKFEALDLNNTLSLSLSSVQQTITKAFDYKTSFSYVAYTLGVFVLSLVPIGRHVRFYSDRGCIDYNFNSIFVSIVALSCLFVGEYLKYSPAKYLLLNLPQYCVLCLLNAFVLSFWMFLRSRYVPQHMWNPYAKSGRFLSDFFVGREITPKWFNYVDIKLVQYRTSLITLLLICAALLQRNLKFPPLMLDEDLTYLANFTHYMENIKFDLVSLVYTGSMLVYVLDWIVYEHHLTSSFELQYEGVGAQLLLRYAATPFLLAAVPKYVFQNRPIDMPAWALTVSVMAFTLGLILKRQSNKLKYEYRLNPNDKRTTLLDSIPTYQGKRLLLSGWWGKIRNPNYLGDIVSILSFLTPLYWRFAWPPLICILFVVVVILHRTGRANARNVSKYNSSWARYCSSVPYFLIRKVY